MGIKSRRVYRALIRLDTVSCELEDHPGRAEGELPLSPGGLVPLGQDGSLVSVEFSQDPSSTTDWTTGEVEVMGAVARALVSFDTPHVADASTNPVIAGIDCWETGFAAVGARCSTAQAGVVLNMVAVVMAET